MPARTRPATFSARPRTLLGGLHHKDIHSAAITGTDTMILILSQIKMHSSKQPYQSRPGKWSTTDLPYLIMRARTILSRSSLALKNWFSVSLLGCSPSNLQISRFSL